MHKFHAFIAFLVLAFRRSTVHFMLTFLIVGERKRHQTNARYPPYDRSL